MSPTDTNSAARPSHSFGLRHEIVVPVVLVCAAMLSVLSGQEPTGNHVADAVITAAFGVGVAWVARWADPAALVLSTVLALFFTGFDLPIALFGIGALASALFTTAWRRLDRDSYIIATAVTAALATQVTLNLPSVRWFGSASVMAAVAVSPIVVTAWPNLPDHHRRVVVRGALAVAAFSVIAAALALFAALSVKSSMERAIEQAQDGVTAIEGGDQERAVGLLEAAEANFDNAGGRLGGPLTWPARVVPIVAQHGRALETAADEGKSLTGAAVRTVTTADTERIRSVGGTIDLAVVDEVHDELVRAETALTGAQQSLTNVRTPWLLPLVDDRLAEVLEELESTEADVDLARHATDVLPGMLGGDGMRRYLVLFVQPAESREFGGFVGGYAILQFDDGTADLAETGSIHRDFGGFEAAFNEPERFPLAYLRVLPDVNPQNVTGIADLPTIAAAARDLVPQWRGDEGFVIDGVMTIDPYGLAGLLELTGPIDTEVTDEPIAADTVVDFLLRDQYREFTDENSLVRQGALREVAGAAFERLLMIDVPGPERLGAVFGPIARANRIGFATYDDETNAFLERIFLLGALPQVGETSELMGVYGATAVASKLDAFSERTLSYTVTVDPATGESTGRAEIIISNDPPDDAPAYVIGADPELTVDGEPAAIGDNVIALGIYSNAELNSFESTGAFEFKATEPTLGYDRSWMLLTVPRRTEQSVTFETRRQGTPGRYDLYVTAQQVANIGDVTLTIMPTDGWSVLASDAKPDGSWTTTLPLDTDRAFSFVFVPRR